MTNEAINKAKEILEDKIKNSCWNEYRINGTFDCVNDIGGEDVLHVVSAVYGMDDFELVPMLLIKHTVNYITYSKVCSIESFIYEFGEDVLNTVIEIL